MRSITLASLAMAACLAGAQTTSPTAAELAAKMNAMTGPDWRPGMELGQELAALPGHQGYEILRDNWRKGAHVEPRKQMLKGWVFRGHPDTLKVIDLAATDPDIRMQNWAFEYLKGIAYTNFAEDYSKYKTWYAKYRDMPLADVKKESASEYWKQLFASTGAERKRYYRGLSRMELVASGADRDRLLAVVREIFADPKADTDAARAAQGILKAAPPDEAFAREVFVPAMESKSSEVQAAATQELAKIQADWVLDLLLARAKGGLANPQAGPMFTLGMGIAEQKQARAIPEVIAMIDAHNGYETVYGLGYFALSPLTGVEYDESHDGPWWRAWWEKNHERFPEPVRSETIPVIPRSPAYKEPQKKVIATPVDAMQAMEQALRDGDAHRAASFAENLAKAKEYRAIPLMIGAIAADDTSETIYGVGYFALSPLTGVEYDESHNGAWWKSWWRKNRARFPAEVRGLSIPKLAMKKAKIDPLVPNEPDVEDIPSENRYAKGDKDMRYLLAGPATKATAPAKAYRLLVVLPGGDGSADFHPFLKRVLRQALPSDFLIAQPVAKKWSEGQFDQIVWPTRTNPWKGARFTTEEFIEAVVADVKKQRKIDPTQVYTMGWSSSGPPVYAHLMSEKRSTAGAFVAMSIFRPEIFPPVDHVKGAPVYILHSPQDFIPISQAEAARDTLTKAGAKVAYATYEGGHGWHGDIFETIRTAIAHLTGN